MHFLRVLLVKVASLNIWSQYITIMIYNYVKFSQGTRVTIGIRYNFDEGVSTSLLHVFFLIIQNNINRKQIKIIVVIILLFRNFHRVNKL